MPQVIHEPIRTLSLSRIARVFSMAGRSGGHASHCR